MLAFDFTFLIKWLSTLKDTSELCEKSFLPRLASWNDGGNPDYRPKTYQDLADLPIILIVVEKGKWKKHELVILGRAT